MFKSSSRMLFAGVIVLMLAVFPVLSVRAVTMEDASGKRIHVITNDTDDDLVVFGGETVIVEGDINGDLFVTAGRVEVTGTVEGNVFAFGGEVTVNNLIGKSLYVAGGTVRLEGEVARDVYAAGGAVTVRSATGEDASVAAGEVIVDAQIGDDLRISAGQAQVRQDVMDDLLVSSGEITIGGNVGGSAHLATGRGNIASSAVGGDLVLYGNGEFNVNRDIVVGGEKRTVEAGTFGKGDQWRGDFDWKMFGGAGLWLKTMFALTQSVGFVLVGYLLFKFAPIRVEETLARINDAEEYLKSSVIGFLAFPVGLMIALFLGFSIVGWPLLQVMVLLFFLSMSVVTPLAGIWLGRKLIPLVGSKRHYVVPLTLGVVVIQLLRSLPILGWCLYALLVFAVIGALLRMQWRKYKVAQNLHVKIRK